MIFLALQCDSNGGDRVPFSVFQEGLLHVLKGGRVPVLPAFRVAWPGENPATGEFLLPPASCMLTIKLVQCSLFNTWGIQLPEKMGAGVTYNTVNAVPHLAEVVLCIQTDVVNYGNISTINNNFTVC